MRVPLAALREPEQGYKMYYMVLNIKRNLVILICFVIAIFIWGGIG